MITTIKQFKKIIKESILVPRNLDGRGDKIKQKNYQLLQQEIIEGDITIDENFIFNTEPIVKTKVIRGNVRIELNYIPLWLENIEIQGNFNCWYTELISLKGCPKIIKGNFYCNTTELTSLEFGPEYVEGDYYSQYNFTENEIRKISKVKGRVYSI